MTSDSVTPDTVTPDAVPPGGSTFQTERLLIRPWTEDPAELTRLFDIYSRSEVARWLGAEPKPMADPELAGDVVRRWAERTTGPYGIWAIEVRETGLVAGTVLLMPMPRSDGSDQGEVEVGWHLHPDGWGHGYATEAARGAVERGFAAGRTEIHAVVRPGNEASVAVTRRLGMSPLGRSTNWYGIELDSFVLGKPGRDGEGSGGGGGQ